MTPIEKTNIITHASAESLAQPYAALSVKGGWWRSLLRQARHGVRRLPSDCPLCGLAARGGNLCVDCARDLAGSVQDAPGRCSRCWLALPLAQMACPDCAVASPAFCCALAAFDYAPPADGLVLALKNGMRLGRAGLLGRLLADAVQQAEILPPVQALVPIPASRASLRRRGFNPAAEIARVLGRELSLPVRPQWLARTRESDKQSRLGRSARRRGAEGLYVCNQPLPAQWVAVVDDVMTTGSTLNSAAQALLAAGAAGGVALAVARTPYALAK